MRVLLVEDDEALGLSIVVRVAGARPPGLAAGELEIDAVSGEILDIEEDD